MSEVRRSARQKVIAAAAVAVVSAGVAFAAVSATGQGNGQRRIHARHGGVHRLHQRDLTAAAGYLAISTEQLEHELSSSGSLAQVAQAHGKPTQGLIDAIVAARRAGLAKAAARLPSRVGAEVNGPARLPRAAAGGRLGIAAAAYLGIAPSQLRAKLRSGRTLAQIAAATPGKSSAGLRDALVSAKKARLAHGVATGKITRARAARSEQRLDKRMSALLQRKFARAGKP